LRADTAKLAFSYEFLVMSYSSTLKSQKNSRVEDKLTKSFLTPKLGLIEPKIIWTKEKLSSLARN
jgi:hypothetical protein